MLKKDLHLLETLPTPVDLPEPLSWQVVMLLLLPQVQLVHL